LERLDRSGCFFFAAVPFFAEAPLFFAFPLSTLFERASNRSTTFVGSPGSLAGVTVSPFFLALISSRTRSA
jgi:hypothetical protein